MTRTVTTETGSVYTVIDEPNGLRSVRWDQDGRSRCYHDVRIGTLTVGEPFIYEGRCEGREYRTVRATTPVVSIEAVAS